MPEQIALSLLAGVTLAFHFNPVTATITALLAAGLAGGKRSPGASRMLLVTAVITAGWLIGDGAVILSNAYDAYTSDAVRIVPAFPEWAEYLALAAWGLGGMTLGYLLPTWAGVFVGRRVTHGTGWASAAWVAASFALVLSMFAGSA